MLRRLLLVIGLIVATGLGFSTAASAHDVLISSNPADNSTLTSVPTSVVFTFDQPVQNFEPAVAVLGPDGKHYETGNPVVSGSTVTGSMTAGPAGAYTASYRIVSADGHPVTGEIHFTLAGDDGAPVVSGPAAGTSAVPSSIPASAGAVTGPPPTRVSSSAPPGTVTPTAAPTSAGVAAPVATSSSGLSAWIWIGLIVAALVIAVAAVVLLRRPGRED